MKLFVFRKRHKDLKCKSGIHLGLLCFREQRLITQNKNKDSKLLSI